MEDVVQTLANETPDEISFYTLDINLTRVKKQHDGRLNFDMPGAIGDKHIDLDWLLNVVLEQELMEVEDLSSFRSKLCIKGLLKKTSNIPGSGFGVFNDREESIEKGTVLGVYGGIIKLGYSKDDIEASSSKYLLSLQESTPDFPRSNIIVEAPEGVMGRYINDCKLSDLALGKCPGVNCMFSKTIWVRNYSFRINKKETSETILSFEEFPIAVLIQATEEIKSGEELFVDYGSNFWPDERKKMRELLLTQTYFRKYPEDAKKQREERAKRRDKRNK